MVFRRCGLIILACLLSSRLSGDPLRGRVLRMLNAEKRVLEDCMYELEYDYEESSRNWNLAGLEETEADGPRLRHRVVKDQSRSGKRNRKRLGKASPRRTNSPRSNCRPE